MIFVEVIFQLAHSFSIFSAILSAVFAWVVARDIDGLFEEKAGNMPVNSGMISGDSLDGMRKKEEENRDTKIEMAPAPQILDSVGDKSDGGEAFN